MSEADLGGRWSGFYSYPDDAMPAVQFEAELRDSAGSITGTTAEVDPFDGATLQAVLDGRRTGSSVRFMKMYDRADEYYDSVRYEGEISADGAEIGGRWYVPGGWSGTFLMVRASGAEAEQERAEAVEVARSAGP